MRTILSTIDTSDYDLPDLKISIDRYVKEFVDSRRAIGCMGKQEEIWIPLNMVSHMVTAIEFNKYVNTVNIKVNILDTPEGIKLNDVIEKCGIGSIYFSIHGLGNIVKGKKHMDTIISINANAKNQ